MNNCQRIEGVFGDLNRSTTTLAGDSNADASKLAAFCAERLDLQGAKLGREYSYASLPLCVIDSVYSIGVRYEGVRNVVRKYCEHFHLPRFRNGSELPKREEQQPLSDLVEKMEMFGIDRFRLEIFQNSQRTSSRGGIAKSEAVFRFARALQKYRIDFFQDIAEHADNRNLESDLRSIPGQSSGISIGYFFMLAGDDTLIKPDRHIMSFLRRCVGRISNIAEARVLISGACRLLKPRYPHLTPRLLDYMIWNWERSQSPI